MRIPPTSSLAVRLRARQVIATTALLWRLPAQRVFVANLSYPLLGHAIGRSAEVSQLPLQGFAL